MDKKIEEYLKRMILPELEKGRPGWDREHTEAVVYFVKKIVDESPELKLDRGVLVIAAYAHDWGYGGLFGGGGNLSYGEIVKMKLKHMEIGARKIEKLMKDKVFDYLSNSQKQRVVHLVGVHDMLGELEDVDELVLMEADTLGALDVDRVKPTFSKESNDKYVEELRKKRFPLFVTEVGKRLKDKLLKKRLDYYEDLGKEDLVK